MWTLPYVLSFRAQYAEYSFVLAKEEVVSYLNNKHLVSLKFSPICWLTKYLLITIYYISIRITEDFICSRKSLTKWKVVSSNPLSISTFSKVTLCDHPVSSHSRCSLVILLRPSPGPQRAAFLPAAQECKLYFGAQQLRSNRRNAECLLLKYLLCGGLSLKRNI